MVRAMLFLFFLFPGGLCAQTFSLPPPTFSQAFLQAGKRERDRIFTDYANLYNGDNVKNFGVALLGGSVLANTKMDGNFQNWHGKHIQSDFSNELSKGAKFFGEGKYFVPIIATSALTYRFLQERRGVPECTIGEFTDRTMRGYLVGAPTLLTMQLALGGSRPNEDKSYWQPFNHKHGGKLQSGHGVSGHAFMGAVPFITAAQMTDRPYIRGLFYVLSTFPAWSRVNDDCHYFSQALLGWYLAYLSVRAVSATEERRPLPRGLTVFPVCWDDSVGIGLHYSF
jgi:hypothetical protein